MSNIIFNTCLVLVSVGFHILPCYAKFRVCMSGTRHVEYDDEVKICCNGEITPRARDQACCNSKTLYFTSLSICCDGKIEDLFVPPKGSRLRSCSGNDEQCRKQMCCGGKPVDKEDNICCDDQPIYLNHTQQLERDFLQCCGGNLINTLSHFCCGGTKYSRISALECCDGQVFDQQAEKCLTNYRPNRIVSKYKSFCGNILYDMKNNSCCNGTLQSIPEMDPAIPVNKNLKLSCCDNAAYDNTKEKCCREIHTGFPTHTIAKEQNIYCCGNGYYNATHQDCYEGRVLEKVPGKIRCGYEYIDGVTKKCCAGKIYNTETHECCSGSRSSVISKDESCCNGQGANETMLCCEGITPSVKKHIDDDECCYNFQRKYAETYNSKKNEHCVQGTVIKLTRGARACGILTFYFPKTQICCGENVYNKSAGFDTCCGEKPFNSKTQQCCNYKVSNISDNEGSCCIKDFKVYRFNDTTNPCSKFCGDKKFDDTQQICCQGVLHDTDGFTECCGSAAINPFSKGCCGGLFSWIKSGNTRCCANKDLYNKKHAKCSNNKVIPRDLTIQKLSNTQYLCSPAALKYFDGGIKYACESQNIFRARLITVQILEEISSNITYIDLSLTDVVGLDRGDGFNSWKGPANLVLKIEVPKHDDIKCRKSYFTKFCRIIIFFNGSLKNGVVKIGRNSKFFMTSYSRMREVLITKKLSHEFCKSNFVLN